MSEDQTCIRQVFLRNILNDSVHICLSTSKIEMIVRFRDCIKELRDCVLIFILPMLLILFYLSTSPRFAIQQFTRFLIS